MVRPDTHSGGRSYRKRKNLNSVKFWKWELILIYGRFLSVDYERNVFNISQADFSDQPSHVIAIPPPNASETGSGGSSTTSGTPGPSTSVTVVSQSSGLGTSAIAGIAVGIVVLAIVLASALIFVIVRKRRRDERPRGDAVELPGEHESPTGFTGYAHYNPFTKNHHDFKRSATTNVDAVEHGGTEIPQPQLSHVAANPTPPTELQAAEVLRAELHSPEPPVSPQSEKPGMDLPMNSSHDMAHTPQREPSTPIAATPSAFRSPTIGFTRFDDVATPPALSPASERDHYFPHR
jgi:hypothetical protein